MAIVHAMDHVAEGAPVNVILDPLIEMVEKMVEDRWEVD